MAKLSFALYAAHAQGAAVEKLAEVLGLPVEWVSERIEAARLCVSVVDRYPVDSLIG